MEYVLTVDTSAVPQVLTFRKRLGWSFLSPLLFSPLAFPCPWVRGWLLLHPTESASVPCAGHVTSSSEQWIGLIALELISDVDVFLICDIYAFYIRLQRPFITAEWTDAATRMLTVVDDTYHDCAQCNEASAFVWCPVCMATQHCMWNKVCLQVHRFQHIVRYFSACPLFHDLGTFVIITGHKYYQLSILILYY